MALPLTGGCPCGGVRFEITEPLPPDGAGYCHCTRCQRRTGTAFSAAARVVPGSFRVVTGEQLIRTWFPDVGFPKAFCRNCGGHLYARHPTDADQLAVRMGSLDADPGVRPSFHQWVDNAAPWEPLPDDGLPRFPGPRG